MSSSNIGEYCRIVKDKSIRRRLQAAADQAVADASNAELEAASALERAEVAIYEIAEREQRGDLLPASTVVAEADPILEQISDSGRPVTGVSTGFVDLDTDTRGLQPGNLILVAARPGMGKTALALNIAQYASVVDDVKTAVFSLEMSRTELMIRLLTASARVDSHRLMRGFCNVGELQRIGTAKAEIAAASLWIDDTSTMTVSSIRGKSRRMKARQGLGLVIIDYLQLLASERRYDSRVVEVGAMSRALKQLAKELAVPVVCLAQLNRASEARGDGRPKLSDLRESGSLEQDADVVLLLYRAAEYSKEADPNEAEIIIAKSRNGPTGSVKLRWSPEMTRFDNYTDRQDGRLVK
jgi:replicative DNA helicase